MTRAERWLPGLLAFTVFAFACGSSTVDLFELVGRPLRWSCLLLVAALGTALAVESREPLRGPLRVAAGLAGALAAVALVSAAWSVDARLSVGRAASLAVLFLAAVTVAHAGSARADLGRRVLAALLLAAVIIAAAGLVVMAFVFSDAVQAATAQYGARYRGMGQNPNTMASLFAVVLPLAAWWLWRARSTRDRTLAAGAFLLLDGSIVASGSRGALLSAALGLFVVGAAAVRTPGRLAAVAAAVAALTVTNVGLAQLPNATKSAEQPVPSSSTRNAQRLLPLEGEIGRGPLDRPKPKIERSLLGGSGRSQAWRGALGQAADQPMLGYGFGTEEKVFVDRYYYFVSGAPENSYIGTALQLGALGVVLLLGLAVTLLWAAARRARRADGAVRAEIGAAAAVVAAGLALAVTQSYILSVGNVATASVWLCGFLALALNQTRPEVPPPRARTSAGATAGT